MDRKKQTSEVLEAIQKIILRETNTSLDMQDSARDGLAPQPSTVSHPSSPTFLEATIATIAQPMVQSWIDANMERVVREIVQEAYQKRDDFNG